MPPCFTRNGRTWRARARARVGITHTDRGFVQTGVKVKVPATKTVTFKVSRGFKSSLNKQQ